MGTTESPSIEQTARARLAQARAERRADRREELLDHAVGLVRRDGPLVSMEQFAAACGVTKPILYRHFGGREGLVQAMAERFVDELVSALAPAIATDAPARELLASTIDAYLRLVEHDTNLYRFLATETAPDRRDLLASMVAQGVAVVLERRLSAVGLDPGNGATWAYGLVGMVHFAGDWWADQGAARRERADVVEALLTLAWDGLASLDLDRT